MGILEILEEVGGTEHNPGEPKAAGPDEADRERCKVHAGNETKAGRHWFRSLSLIDGWISLISLS